MNAKDTVIGGVPRMSMALAKAIVGRDDFEEFLMVIQREREAQAERSFKAGQQSGSFVEGIAVGRKEVVEWFENNRGASYQGGFLVNGQLWQNQLKGWGLEK